MTEQPRQFGADFSIVRRIREPVAQHPFGALHIAPQERCATLLYKCPDHVTLLPAPLGATQIRR
jgi:hypothetical protein